MPRTENYKSTKVYRLGLDQPPTVLAAARALLARDELARADRFVVEPPRIQFTLCRAALRTLLAQRLGCSAQEVRFGTSSLGKPFVLAEDSTQPFYFNVSHSGEFGLIALSDEPVGVDVEKLQPRINAKSLVSQVVSTEELRKWAQLAAAEHATQIIRLWVCKEAMLKAMGLGIAECLKQISFQLPIESSGPFQLQRIDPAVQVHLEESGDCRCNPWLSTAFWIARPLGIHHDYFAAVVTAKQCAEVELLDFEFDFSV